MYSYGVLIELTSLLLYRFIVRENSLFCNDIEIGNVIFKQKKKVESAHVALWSYLLLARLSLHSQIDHFNTYNIVLPIHLCWQDYHYILRQIILVPTILLCLSIFVDLYDILLNDLKMFFFIEWRKLRYTRGLNFFFSVLYNLTEDCSSVLMQTRR